MTGRHPSDATLVAYAAGTLALLHQQVVALHLFQCPACRAAEAFGREIGGALLDVERPAALADDALARAFERLERAVPATLPKAPAALPTLDSLTKGRRWRRVGYGIRLMPLVPRDTTGTRLDLVRVAPGISLPQHDHTGPEMACVLQGGFADASGEYHAGDVAEGDVGLDHQPRALAGEECICLIATTGYLRAHSLIARLLQPLFGI
jgi:putative transcriptional regulator